MSWTCASPRQDATGHHRQGQCGHREGGGARGHRCTAEEGRDHRVPSPRPKAFRKFVEEEYTRWGKLIRKKHRDRLIDAEFRALIQVDCQ